MRVLITNIVLASRSGTTMYVRDLALELQRRGHTPLVYTFAAGRVAAELQRAGVFVTETLWRIRKRPDVIHGHHYATTLSAVAHFPNVPAIHICHDHASPTDRTPRHARIVRHFGVSRVCIDRVVRDGVRREQIEHAFNSVDLDRFKARLPLPKTPKRALIFSNYASESTHVPPVRAACAQLGIALDVVGQQYGGEVEPDRLLANYDVVFAKARAALEALAVGCAVVLCDASGLGPLVTSAEFARLRSMNFGFEALCAPFGPEDVVDRLQGYDAVDSECLRELTRTQASVASAVDALERIYYEVSTSLPLPVAGPPSLQGVLRSRLNHKIGEWWADLSPQRRAAIKGVPGVPSLAHAVRSVLEGN